MKKLSQSKLKDAIADTLALVKVAEQLEMTEEKAALEIVAKAFLKKLETMAE